MHAPYLVLTINHTKCDNNVPLFGGPKSKKHPLSKEDQREAKLEFDPVRNYVRMDRFLKAASYQLCDDSIVASPYFFCAPMLLLKFKDSLN